MLHFRMVGSLRRVFSGDLIQGYLKRAIVEEPCAGPNGAPSRAKGAQLLTEGCGGDYPCVALGVGTPALEAVDRYNRKVFRRANDKNAKCSRAPSARGFVLTVTFFSNRFNLSTDGPYWSEVAARPWVFMQRTVRRRKAY